VIYIDITWTNFSLLYIFFNYSL